MLPLRFFSYVKCDERPILVERHNWRILCFALWFSLHYLVVVMQYITQASCRMEEKHVYYVLQLLLQTCLVKLGSLPKLSFVTSSITWQNLPYNKVFFLESDSETHRSKPKPSTQDGFMKPRLYSCVWYMRHVFLLSHFTFVCNHRAKGVVRWCFVCLLLHPFLLCSFLVTYIHLYH